MENYLFFIGASILLCIAPGPDMVYLLGRSIAQGRLAGIVAAIGINVGAYVHLVAAILGLSAILMTSAIAFAIVKWIGAAYLIYIGLQVLLSSTSVIDANSTSKSQLSLKAVFWQGFLSDVLNPKVAVFYLAFLPQFVDTNVGSEISQLIFLGVTVNMVAIFINIPLVLCASYLTAKLRKNEVISKWLSKAMGIVFVYLGIRLSRESFS
ncbi:MAG: LysE family translocator [Calditrichia bacterium]